MIRNNIPKLILSLAGFILASCQTPSVISQTSESLDRTDFHSTLREISEANEIDRIFVNSGFGDLHLRIARPQASDIRYPPLVLFHPNPYSSQFFIPFMERMAKDRIVIGVDTPGYGDSERPSEPQSIAKLSETISQGLNELGLQGPYDVLGYHTGTLLATEIALSNPDVRRLVLPGIPYMTGEERAIAYRTYVKPTELSADGSHLQSKWNMASIAVKDGQSILKAQAQFSDMMQAFPYEWWAYHGVFSYEGENRFPLLQQPTRVIAVSGSLKEESQAAAALIPNGEFVLLENVNHGLFDIHLDEIENATRMFLDTP